MTGCVAHDTPTSIAHVIDTDGPGGAEHVVVQLATGLQAVGFRNVAVLPANREGWLARQLEGSGVTIEYFRAERGRARACAASLEQTFRRHRITLAHSHEFPMAVYGAWAARRAGIPHVITMHGGRYYAERLRRRLALRAAIGLSGRTVTVSNRLAQQMSRDLWVRMSRIVRIPNGVGYTRPERTTVREELRLPPNARLLIAVGNLYPVKGHRHLVDALALLVERHPTLHLAIAGRGDMAATLSAQARELGVANRVHLLGLRSDVAAVLTAADVFVLPSLSEGLPLALLEAMFAGCPIVASEVGDIGEALQHGEAGVLVEAGNSAALAAAIDRLLVDRTLARQLGERAAQRAAAGYAASQMVRRYVALYEALLRRRASRQSFGLVRGSVRT